MTSKGKQIGLYLTENIFLIISQSQEIIESFQSDLKWMRLEEKEDFVRFAAKLLNFFFFYTPTLTIVGL